jgi:hypothetical protein
LPCASSGTQALSLPNGAAGYRLGKVGVNGAIQPVALDLLGTGGNAIYSSDNPVAGSEPAFPVTASIWVHLRAYSSFGGIFNKMYRSYPTWTSPFRTISILLDNIGGGAWYASITTGAPGAGAVVNLAIPAGPGTSILLNQWCHVGLTYDGATLSAYLNGNLVGTMAVAGALDYNTGIHGPWIFGGTPQPDGINGQLQDFRLANVIRPASWFSQVYRTGTLAGP